MGEEGGIVQQTGGGRWLRRRCSIGNPAACCACARDSAENAAPVPRVPSLLPAAPGSPEPAVLQMLRLRRLHQLCCKCYARAARTSCAAKAMPAPRTAALTHPPSASTGCPSPLHGSTAGGPHPAAPRAAPAPALHPLARRRRACARPADAARCAASP
eukprot:366224-Chlamydomonas_euryale.AAC.4